MRHCLVWSKINLLLGERTEIGCFFSPSFAAPCFFSAPECMWFFSADRSLRLDCASKFSVKFSAMVVEGFECTHSSLCVCLRVFIWRSFFSQPFGAVAVY